MKRYASIACLLALFCSSAHAQIGPRVCKSVPTHKVKFDNPADILYPPVSLDEGAKNVFVIEQIIYPSFALDETRLVVRDKTGGLHIAVPNTIVGAITKETIEARRDGNCVEDDPKTYAILAKHFDKERNRALAEADRKLYEEKGEMTCTISSISKVKLTDKGLAQVSQFADLNSYRKKPPGMRMFGFGFQSANPMARLSDPRSTALLNNSFTLVGEIVPYKTAPKEFHHISDKDEPVSDKPNLTGKFLVSDQYGMNHVVNAEDLSENSKSLISQSKFVCHKVSEAAGTDSEVIHPDFKPEKSPTIEQ
jgi:hypothetical protein